MFNHLSSLSKIIFLFVLFFNTAQCYTQVTASWSGDFNFGRFAKVSGGFGTITLPIGGGTPSATGDIMLISKGSNWTTPTLSFSTNSNKNGGVLVTISGPTLSNPIVVSGTGGTLDLYVEFSNNSFRVYKGSTEYIDMGGTLIVGTTAGTGSYYRADLPLIFNYN